MAAILDVSEMMHHGKVSPIIVIELIRFSFLELNLT